MKTSYFGSKLIVPDRHIAVRISRGYPRFKIDYKPIPVEQLWPSRAMLDTLRGKREEFTTAYVDLLETQGFDAIQRVLREVQATAPDRELVLLCFEKPGDFCHRSLFATWWQGHTGERVDELQRPEGGDGGSAPMGSAAPPRRPGGAAVAAPRQRTFDGLFYDQKPSMMRALRVPSDSQPGGFYEIVVTASGRATCSCPDHQHRRRTCKHMRRCGLEAVELIQTSTAQEGAVFDPEQFRAVSG